MASDNDDDTGAVVTAGALGGGALLLWWLLRGRGRGLARVGDRMDPQADAGPTVPPCRVFLRGASIEVNGQGVDLPTAVETCRAAGTAHLRASGDTTTSAVMQVARMLNAAGVAMLAHGDIAEAVRDALTRSA